MMWRSAATARGLTALMACAAIGACGGNLTVDLDDPAFGGRIGNQNGNGNGNGNENGNENGTNGNANGNTNGNENGTGNQNGNANENGSGNNNNGNGNNVNGNNNNNNGFEGCTTLVCDNVCCAAGEQCIDGTCRLPDDCGSTDFCGAGGPTPRCCPEAAPVCVFGQFCQAECASPDAERCGANGEVCCDAGFVCGDSLTCVRECAPDQALCGDGTAGSFGTACCPVGDECIFDSCVTPGGECASFLDCENGEYCELVLDADPQNPDPNRGRCLPDDFPEDVPICQARPDDILLPQTEWRWLGLEIRDLGSLIAGEIVPECDGPSDTACYVYPCTDFDDGGSCFNNVEAIPVVADLDRVVQPDASAVPEVVIKSYRDGSFNDNNIIAVLDGRSGETLQVYYGDARGHVAVANLDSDPELEIVSLGQGLKAYEPFPASDVCPARPDENACEDPDDECRWRNGTCVRRQARKWFTNDAAYRLNENFRAGAPALTDLNADGRPEIIVSTAVIDAETGAGLAVCPTDGGGTANTGEDWYISVVADPDLDGRPEIVTGNSLYEVQYNAGTDSWSCDALNENWRARRPPPADDTDGLGSGFPGLGNFIDNQRWPYAPRPATDCEGLTEPECTGSCAWNDSECLYDASSACAAIADEAECNSYLACRFDAGVCGENTAETALYPVDRDYPEVVTTDNGRLFITHGATGRVMKSPADGQTLLDFRFFSSRGGTPNVADFDGDGRVEVSYAGTGCMAVLDADCAVGSASRRRGEFVDWESSCGEPNIWQHPLCETCATSSDPICQTCRVDDPSAEACIAALPGCGRTPLDSHRPGYLTDNDQLACQNAIEEDALRDMIGALWLRQSQDASSAATGTSVFDFQGDGKAEVLYGDECFFRVYNGETGALLFERPNSHRTATEYPIVVDVDGDSQSEILVGSNSDQATGRDGCGNIVPSVDCSAVNVERGDFNGEDGFNDADRRLWCEDGDTGSAQPNRGCHWRDGECRRFAYRRPAGSYELYTPSYCECGNYDICEGLDETACIETLGCAFTGACAPIDCGAITDSVACNATRACAYDSDATRCERSTLHPAVQCNLGDGCFFDEDADSCAPVDCGALDETSCGENVACDWNGSSCVQGPRHPSYICENATWGLTAIGDTRDQWVRTLPYWHQHSFHVTEIDRQGQPVADWSPNPDNWDIYNNYRQNVQGFVPLNAPDLQIFSFAASLAQCPTQLRLAARVVNRGRAGVAEGTPIVFYWLDGSTPVEVGTVGLPYAILPGQGADVTLDVVLGDFGISPVSSAYLVVANPPEGFEPVFECDGDNNTASVSGLSCFDGGG